MTEVAAPHAETDPRRRAMESVINHTVRGFAEEGSKCIPDELRGSVPTISNSTVYNHISYNSNISSSHAASNKIEI